MTGYRNRTRLGLEQIEDRCTPSAVLADPGVELPVHHGGSPVAQVAAGHAGPHAAAATRQVVPVILTAQCSADLSTMKATATGFATHLGRWTAQGRIDKADFGADRAAVRGTLTIVAANGDKLFVSFSASWRLSTGKGTELITVTGGTGQYAGATGGAVLRCTMTVDPVAQTIACNCQGVGFLVLPLR
jgi:hypothetical protein